MSIYARISVLAAIAVLALAQVSAYASGPVARVTEIQGSIEFSRDGERWEPVTRTKYLFPSQYVRSGSDSSATVINQASGEINDLGAGTTIKVVDGTLEVVAGSNFGVQQQASGGFWQALRNKFATTQRYTTVRRSVRSADEQPQVDTARNIAVGAPWPELVWSNAGPEYAYRLHIGDQTFDISPSSTSEMIRFRVPELASGEHTYAVDVILDGETVYTPRRRSTLNWLDAEQTAAIKAELEAMRADPVRNDPFLIADYLEEQDLLVPALDTYREFFQSYPDENDMRPFLIKAYHDLRLLDLREKEAITYNTVEMMGGSTP
ncbi:MAG: hypothetical protein JJU22_08260 [Gammaproteobacteria bacterium]|jgi:hypothetical protein|nr:hypothetical protein [Gammaproteobacteria bacterium]